MGDRTQTTGEQLQGRKDRRRGNTDDGGRCCAAMWLGSRAT